MRTASPTLVSGALTAADEHRWGTLEEPAFLGVTRALRQALRANGASATSLDQAQIARMKENCNERPVWQ
jgi:hypothetical protein